MKIAVRLAVVLSLVVLASPVSASLLDYAGSAYDDGTTVWSGTVNFNADGYFGQVDWIVFPAADFSTDFIGYVPSGDYVYTYQLSPAIGSAVGSNFQVIVTNPANNAGSFSGGTVSGDAPIGTPIVANWSFSGIAAGSSSMGMAFSSDRVPEFGFGSTADGGEAIDLFLLPTPSENIPEPTVLSMLFLGLGSLAIYRRR